MAISVAADWVTNSGGSAVTSTNFDVTTSDLIVVVAACDTNGTAAVVWTLSDNQAPDLTYTQIGQRDDNDGLPGGVSAWFHKVVSPITGLNITATVSGSATPDSPAIKVFKLVSGDYDSADPLGVQTEGDLTADPQNTGSITPETSGTGIAVWEDFNETGVPTSSDLTMTGFDTAAQIAGGAGYKTLSAGVGATANINSGGVPQGNYLWFEIRAASGGTPKWGGQLLLGGVGN